MQLPGPLRAVIGLAANVADEARHLPDRAIELPMLAVSTVLQLSLRAQQRYAMLTARGDEVLSGQAGEEPPAWATFDDDADVGFGRPPATGADAARDATAILDEIFGALGHGPDGDDLTPPTPITAAPSASDHRGTDPVPDLAAPPAASAAKAPAERATAKKATAKKTAAKKTAARKAAAKKTVASKATDTSDTEAPSGKRVSKPRHTAPSKFDDVDD